MIHQILNPFWRKTGKTMPQETSWQELVEDSNDKGQRVARRLWNKIRRTPAQDQDETWKQEVQALADQVPAQHLTHPLLRAFEKHKIRAGGGVSFHRYMVEQSEFLKMKLKVPSWTLNQKVVAYHFVDVLGVRRPGADLSPRRLKDVHWRCPGVLKAVSSTGGRGTYLVLAEDEVVHVFDGERFSSRDEVEHHARSLMNPANGRRLPNRWISEELILEDKESRIPARDVKFFCFYGEVLFTLEVIRQGKDSLYSFAQPDGPAIKPGDWNYSYFDGGGPAAEGLELATEISREIPHPFMRIDMLMGENELVFGEFTPRPGGFHRFNREWDRRMGEAWARAEDRLQADLLTGKRFDAFLSSTGLYNTA